MGVSEWIAVIGWQRDWQVVVMRPWISAWCGCDWLAPAESDVIGQVLFEFGWMPAM